MADRSQRNSRQGDEALSRFLVASPETLAKVYQTTHEQIDVARKDADERRNRLREANRGPAERFRL